MFAFSVQSFAVHPQPIQGRHAKRTAEIAITAATELTVVKTQPESTGDLLGDLVQRQCAF